MAQTDDDDGRIQWQGLREVIPTAAGTVRVYGVIDEDDRPRFAIVMPDELLDEGDLVILAGRLRALAISVHDDEAVS